MLLTKHEVKMADIGQILFFFLAFLWTETNDLFIFPAHGASHIINIGMLRMQELFFWGGGGGHCGSNEILCFLLKTELSELHL